MIDEVVVEFSSGTGGSGSVAFHREKHVPRGGPNGADGGKGGDVILIADRGCRTLYDLKLREKIAAENGVHAHNQKRGKNGESITVKVPVGTVITDVVLDEPLVDLNYHGAKYIIAKGGRGGFGNMHYVSSVRQVPNFAQKGAPGEVVRARLEIKLLADVGLIGLPNAGKSTTLSRISAAKPKIADYPFTTITPNLGVAKVADQTFVVADMPGLIEGASQGHGLGHQFLRHIERTKLLIHIVDVYPVDESDPVANYKLIEEELKTYSESVWSRPRIIALNKIDVLPAEFLDELSAKFNEFGHQVFNISAVTGHGIEPLLFAAAKILTEIEATEPVQVIMPAQVTKMDDAWDCIVVKDGYEITGRRMLRMVAMTNLENKDAVRYLHRRLDRLGAIEKLRDLGAEEGDTVFIGNHVFSFSDW